MGIDGKQKTLYPSLFFYRRPDEGAHGLRIASVVLESLLSSFKK